MAYVIQFLKGGAEKRDKVYSYLQDRIAKDGRFRCQMELGEEKTTRADRVQIGKVYSVPCIRISKVRLTEKKPYCGNHPGECIINPFLGPQKKPNATYLEWNDWVAFHALVNKTMNRFKANANIWTLPHDVKGRMWIRKGQLPRRRYEWTEHVDNYGRIVRSWNQGTEDQFY